MAQTDITRRVGRGKAGKQVVICGAGIAGIAAAYHLASDGGNDDIVILEAANPLSLTSDKSTEGYRNWWPGPDAAMTSFMNRSIDLLEAIAGASGNRINMNRRGYLFASADADKLPTLLALATTAERLGSGPVRLHTTSGSGYRPSPPQGIDAALTGADLITEPSLIRAHFPYLTADTRVVLHARRAGWLSAQQLGMVMLEAARERGVKLIRATLIDVELRGGGVSAVWVEREGERQRLEATHLVIAAGPMQRQVAALVGVELPVFAERHQKIGFADRLGAVPRAAPMLIWLDQQHLPWTDAERAVIAQEPDTAFLLKAFPPGVHARPEGAGTTVLGLFNYDTRPAEVIFPLPESPHYAEITLRGLATMVPAVKDYFGRGVRPVIDGGYYIKTRENRPLIGPLPVEGAFITGAFSGFGVMAACAGGELLARHVAEAPLPPYASAFLLARYRDPAYAELIERSGDGGQL